MAEDKRDQGLIPPPEQEELELSKKEEKPQEDTPDEEEELPLAAITLSQGEPIDLLETNVGEEVNKDIHICRLGKLFDLGTGDLILDLDEDSAEAMARVTQSNIDAGHALPISMEHGIESGQRGNPNADRRPYGEVSKVYFDKERGGIFATKKWTRLGKETLEAGQTEDGQTAYRISPRICFSPAYHPETGEVIGEAPGYIDVVSLTVLPRTNSLDNVRLSRTTSDDTQPQEDTGAVKCDELTQVAPQPPENLSRENHEDQIMADKNENTEEIILSRDSEEAKRIYTALDLTEPAPAIELARLVEGMKDKLAEAYVELSRFKQEEADRAQVIKEAKVDEELGGYEFPSETEKTFFRTSLLSDNEETVTLAREALTSRTAPDKSLVVEEAINNAKERGSLPADFVMTEEFKALAETGTELAVNLINAIPGGNVVRIGEAAGSDVAGIQTTTAVDSTTAEKQLHRLARSHRISGKATNNAEAWELARAERPELDAIVFGD